MFSPSRTFAYIFTKSAATPDTIFKILSFISLPSIIEQELPIPRRDMIPISLEEQVICFADKFFSKNHLDHEKSIDKALKTISKYGEEGVKRFNGWCECFL